MELILQVFYSIFSGVILAIAIPNELYLFGCPYFSLFAFIPYYLVFNRIKNYREAFLCGFLQAITTHLISSYWLAYFKDFAALTLGASAFGTGMIGAVFGLLLYLPYADFDVQNKLNENCLFRNFTKTPVFRIFYFAAMYVVYEWVKSSGFLGYPWGTVSSTMFRLAVLKQISAITGTYGITFIIVLLNAILAEVYIHYIEKTGQEDYPRFYAISLSGKFFLVLFAVTLVYGVFQYDLPRKPVKTLNTVLVQQNSNPWDENTDDKSILLSEDLTSRQVEELKKQDKEPQLVVWSEGCLKYNFPSSESHYNYFPEEKPLTGFIRDLQIPFILGGSYTKSIEYKKYHNVALLFDKDGRFRGYYGKNHLVPFAEALPFIEYPIVGAFMKKVVGISAGWTPGDQYSFFEVPCTTTKDYMPPAVKNISLNTDYYVQKEEDSKPVTVKIATPICFDDSFTDIMRPLFLNGAELFVNITDDSWSRTKSSELQHFVIASYRAIEYRTTLVRSANAGYSVVVDPAGKIIHDMPLFEAASSSFNIPVYSHKMTTYARFGNWLPYTFVFLFFAYAFYSWYVFKADDYIPSERKIKKGHKSHKEKEHKKSRKNSKK